MFDSTFGKFSVDSSRRYNIISKATVYQSTAEIDKMTAENIGTYICEESSAKAMELRTAIHINFRPMSSKLWKRYFYFVIIASPLCPIQ